MLLKKDLVLAGLALAQGALASLQIVSLSWTDKYDSKGCVNNMRRSPVRPGQQLVQTSTSRLMEEVSI